MPNADFGGENFAFELISIPNAKNPLVKNFFIGFRQNFKNYTFVLSIEDFNKIAGLMLIEPEFSEYERESFCNSQTAK
jgi:hypothetical protein